MADLKTYPDIAARLRRVREGFSDCNRKEWAKHHGFNPTQYTNWENGTRRIPIDAASALSAKYGLTLDWIYLGREDALSATARNAVSSSSQN
ncbi:XRE family transcriptional regulator [Aliishimia ponticola]|uniref:XRE family transcriptional regulator n=1 Tax=Aliishimia ponticola TaxID=2499833 RepID=A0A4S4NCU0_9RHOB|nr:helix-turn-helix transcriptional regulator [Aliishimia ponticola]THH36565.1 XRE family transcriptional regulator [Aliishimia ponticola]